MYKRRKKTFRWQINASAVGKLLGHFGRDSQQKALAECWHMNLKRMPRFGAIPAEMPTQKPVAEVVREQLAKPVFRQMVEQGISKPLEQKAVTERIKQVAKQEVDSTKRKFTESVEQLNSAAEIKMLPDFKTKKAGMARAPRGYFTVKDKVYHKPSARFATISTIEEAMANGYRKPAQKAVIVKAATEKMVEAKKEAVVAASVAKYAQKSATTVINTTRGIRRESTDLEMVQKRFPTVRNDQNKAYFMNLEGNAYGAFIIGKIDGISPDCIFELKHRQSRLFRELRGYEQVQCIMYMKMVKLPRLMLVETYQGQQLYYELKLDNGQCQYRPEGGEWKIGLTWDDIKGAIERVVGELNRAEMNSEFREHLKTFLF